MAGDITDRHLLKVAELIGTDWQRLGTELGIPWVELDMLATPSTGGPSEYAKRMLNTWHLKNADKTTAQVKEALVAALEEAHRNDVAAVVQDTLKTENDIQRVFQDISEDLVKDWRILGIFLGIPSKKLEVVRAHPGLEEDPRQKVLQMWQKRTPRQDQHNQLINAVRKLQREDIVIAIEKLDSSARQGRPIQESSLFTQESQTLPTGANTANTLFEHSDESEDQHDASTQPGHGTVKEGDVTMRDTMAALLRKLDLTQPLRAALQKANLIMADIDHQIDVAPTSMERSEIILGALSSKGDEAFRDFYYILCQEDKSQQHLLTELGLNIDDILVHGALKRALQQGSRRVCRSRVSFIGHYAAGKTSLKRCLLGDAFIEEYDPTNGIEADPSKAKIDITAAKGWKRQKGEADVIRFVADFTGEKMRANTDSPQVKAERSELSDEADNRTDPPKGVLNEEQEAKVKKIVLERQDEDRFLAELFLWDYGGQREYYDTHMTFLTKETIYVVVMDMTKPLHKVLTYKDPFGNEVQDSSGQTPADYLDYWCSCVHSFVSQEKIEPARHGQAAMPPIIIVCTHKDEPNADPSYVSKVQEYISGRSYWNHINNAIFTISNKNPNEKDLSNIKDTVSALATMQSYEVPIKWMQFLEETKKDAKSFPWKTSEQTEAIASQLAMGDMTDALKYFHEKGELIFFDEKGLGDIIITDPQWLIDRFSAVFTIGIKRKHGYNSNKYWRNLDRFGLLTEALLDIAWKEDFNIARDARQVKDAIDVKYAKDINDYTEVKKVLVALMTKYSLLCAIKNPEQLEKLKFGYKEDEDRKYNLYLVPSLIPKRDIDQTTSISSVFLIPLSGFIPIGLTSRLIAGLMNEKKTKEEAKEKEEEKQEEEKWQLLNISKDEAIFLPKGDNSEFALHIKGAMNRTDGTTDKIVVGLIKVDDKVDLAHCDVSDSLAAVCSTLHSITQSVCPQPGFRVMLQCPECKKKGKEELEPAYKKEQLCMEFICAGMPIRKWYMFDHYKYWFQKPVAKTVPRDQPMTRAYKELTYADVKRLITDHKTKFYDRFDPNDRVVAELKKAKVIDAATEDRLMAAHITPVERMKEILDTIQRKGVEALLNFCKVVYEDDINQKYLVTEVLGLNIADIRHQLRKLALHP